MNDSQPRDFIRQIIDEDIASGKHGGKVITRFPPEPNGYLHVGHAKSICLNFGVAAEYDGTVRWQDVAPALRDAFARAGQNAKVGSDQTYQEAVSRKQDLDELVRGARVA